MARNPGNREGAAGEGGIVLKQWFPTELHFIFFILVNCSMVLTGYFGWTWADGILPLQIVLALIFAVISRAVGKMFRNAAYYSAQGHMMLASRSIIIGCIFAVANVVTDYGAATSIRDRNITMAQNANNVARDARTEVTRLENRIAEIRSQAEWKTDYRAPAAYDAEVMKLKSATERGRNIWQRSKQCNDTTLASSQTVCQAIASALADKQNALERQKLKGEMLVLERELVEAKANSVDNAMVSSAPLAQVKALIAWVTFDRAHGERELFWGNNAVMLIISILVSIGIIYLGLEIGRLEAHDDAGGDPYQAQYNNKWIADHRPADIRHAEASRQGASVSSTTIVTNADDTLEELARLIEEVNRTHTVH